ncbi:MAG: hypothetical protein ABIT01_10040 [Thermoanaerobaculia bacterium]
MVGLSTARDSPPDRPQLIVDQAIASIALASSVDVDLEAIRTLLTGGNEALAARTGFSKRTVRRAFVAAGTRISDFLLLERPDAAKHLLEAGVDSDVMAAVLSFSSDETLHRFLRREFGGRIRELKQAALGLTRTPKSVIRVSGNVTIARIRQLDNRDRRNEIADRRQTDRRSLRVSTGEHS